MDYFLYPNHIFAKGISKTLKKLKAREVTGNLCENDVGEKVGWHKFTRCKFYILFRPPLGSNEYSQVI